MRFAPRARWLFSLGALALLGGLGLSRFASHRGTADIRVGRILDRLADGRPLPFRIRLDAMAVDAPEPPARAILRRGEAEADLDPVEGSSADFGSLRATVTRVLPRAFAEHAFRERNQGPENPVLHLLLGLGAPVPLEGYLVAADRERRRFDEPGGRFAVVYAGHWDPAMAASLRSRPGVLRFTFGGRTFTRDAAPGIWRFPSFDLHILDVFPDLGMAVGKDGTPKAFHRSRAPRNPWVLLRLAKKDGQASDLLVAAEPPQDPEYSAALSAALPPGAQLRYDRTEEERASRFLILTLDGRGHLIEHGRLIRTEDLPIGKPFIVAKGLSVTVLERFTRAEMLTGYRPADPGEPATSALELRVEDPSRQLQDVRWLEREGPEQDLPPAGLKARYGPPAPSREAVRARITVLDPGESPLASRTLTGSESLSIRGYRLQLGRGASMRGRWVRIAVTRDPWRALPWLGLGLIGLAAAFGAWR